MLNIFRMLIHPSSGACDLFVELFRMLIHPSSGACDLFVELFHGLCCSGSMCVGVTVWFGWGGVVSGCRLKDFSTIKMMHGPINISFLVSFVHNPCGLFSSFRSAFCCLSFLQSEYVLVMER